MQSKRRVVVQRQRVTIGTDGEEVRVSTPVARENAHGQAYQMMGLQLMREHFAAEKRARALQIKTEAEQETRRVKLEAELERERRRRCRRGWARMNMIIGAVAICLPHHRHGRRSMRPCWPAT